MATQFSHGTFKPKNPKKYIGLSAPKWRSSWEWALMNFFDTHNSVEFWASESIKIPYQNPLTSSGSLYIPDFFVIYRDQNKIKHTELIEVKPYNQTGIKEAGKSKRNQTAASQNQAKWEAAKAWCASKGIVFRVLTERELFHVGQKMPKVKNIRAKKKCQKN